MSDPFQDSTEPAATHPGSTPSLSLRIVAWFVFLIYAWLILATIGTIAGTTIIGGLRILMHLGEPDTWLHHLGRGAYFGLQYLGKVWGPGGAIVLCFVKAHRLRKDGKTITQALFWPLGG